MITKTINLYDYTELSDAAKEKAKEWYLSDPIRSVMLTEMYGESWTNYYFPHSDLHVEWSLSNCQGDGVNIFGRLELIDIINYMRHWNTEEHPYRCAHCPTAELKFEDINLLEKYVVATNAYTKIPTNPRYTYCVANCIDFADYMMEELNFSRINQVDKKLLYRFQKEVINIITSLCYEMAQAGYDYLYNVEEGEMLDACEANEWYFTKNGKFDVA